MKLVSTTLTNNCEAIIGDALRSVLPFVDKCIVIDTGCTDDTMMVAEQVCGDKFEWSEFPWKNDFSAARNFALAEAKRLGADWAITVDTDERINLNGLDIRSVLENSVFDSWGMEHSSRTYAKTRAIKIPAKSKWMEPTHECFSVHNSNIFDIAVFDELHKTPSDLEQKFNRDVEILTKVVEENPQNQRAWYYLGTSYEGIRDWKRAIDAFAHCTTCNGWAEECSRAAYRAAECFCLLEMWDAAVHSCAKSLAIFPSMSESAWLAGYACSKAGRGQDAYAWAKMAEATSYFTGCGKEFVRTGFKTVTALYEGPHDLMRFHAPTIEGQKTHDDIYKVAIEARLRG